MLRLNILHVYRTYFPESQGGLEEVIRQICLNTQSHGITSRVMSLAEKSSPLVIRRDEARVYRSRKDIEVASCSMSLRAFTLYRRLARWADVIHFHFPWPFADLLRLSSPTDTPTLVTYHSDIVRQRFLIKLYAPMMRRFLRSMDRIVCTSPNYFATSDVLLKFENKVDVVPIGLDETAYPKPSEDTINEVRQRIGEGFFLFVGVLRYYKGLHILLEAMQNAPYRVVIAGSGPTESELKKQAAELRLNNVVFTGHVSDEEKVALFKLAKGVVFPSYLRSEAFGVTLLEGAMYSKPLISTEVGSGTSHVNIDGETGIVVTPGSAKALRHAMDQLHHRPEMAQLMGARARRRYELLFTGKLMGERYAQLYRDLKSAPAIAAEPIARVAGGVD